MTANAGGGHSDTGRDEKCSASKRRTLAETARLARIDFDIEQRTGKAPSLPRRLHAMSLDREASGDLCSERERRWHARLQLRGEIVAVQVQLCSLVTREGDLDLLALHDAHSAAVGPPIFDRDGKLVRRACLRSCAGVADVRSCDQYEEHSSHPHGQGRTGRGHGSFAGVKWLEGVKRVARPNNGSKMARA